MRMTGLGMAFAHMRNRKPTRKCERCGLRYPVDQDACPHCTGLSESQLDALKARIARRHVANGRLGRGFLLGAVAIVLVMLLVLA